MSKRPELLTRERFVARRRAEGRDEDAASATYFYLVGAKGVSPECVLDALRSTIESDAKAIKQHVNKFVAHRDRTTHEGVAMFKALEGAAEAAAAAEAVAAVTAARAVVSASWGDLNRAVNAMVAHYSTVGLWLTGTDDTGEVLLPSWRSGVAGLYQVGRGDPLPT